MSEFKVVIPASTANIGAGFDSAGMALSRYLTIHVKQQEEWDIVNRSPFLPAVEHYEEHFIYQIAQQIAQKQNRELPPCKMTIESEIPLARGLGSSASAVIAGIEMANLLCDLNLTDAEKLQYATAVEGHPDNVAAALHGGLVITSMANSIEYVRLPMPAVDVVIYIPSTELKTEAARKVLPDTFSRHDAATASSISNVMIAAFLAGDFSLAGKLMEEDMFHEPYRAELIPDYSKIKAEAKDQGAYGTVISGAGPTMISFVPKDKGEAFASHMKKICHDHEVAALKIDEKGVQVEHNNFSIGREKC